MPRTRVRTALDVQGDLKQMDESFDKAIEFLANHLREDLGNVRLSLRATIDSLMEEARAEGYRQALTDANAALMTGMPALRLLLTTQMPPRPLGQEIEREPPQA